jgi:phage terminase large subunit-like protein
MSSIAGIIQANNLAELREKILERMRADLIFTVRHIFGKDFLDAPFHEKLAQFMWREDLHPQTLVLAPRGSGKSTIGICKIAAKFLLNPDSRQLLVSYDMDQAVKFIAAARDLIIKPPTKGFDWVGLLFPDIRRIVAEAEVRRDFQLYRELNKSGRTDPHIAAASINSGITGMHVDIEVDDLIDEVHARSEADCKRARDWVDVTFNALEHQTRGVYQFRGTHYHLRDPYAYIMEAYPHFAIFRHPALMRIPREDGTTEYASYWPSRFSVEDLLEMQRRNPYQFASQLQQQPIQAGDSAFRLEWLKYWNWSEHGNEIATDDGRVVRMSDLTIAVIYDPAVASDSSRSDTAVIAVGMDSEFNYYVLDTWAARCSPNEGVKATIAMASRWQPDMIAVEEVLFSTLLVPLLENSAKESRIAAYRVTPVSPAGRSKSTRILALQALFEEGRFYLRKDQDQLIEQYMQFPYGRKYDLLDALAYAPQILYPPLGSFAPAKAPARNRITGY